MVTRGVLERMDANRYNVQHFALRSRAKGVICMHACEEREVHVIHGGVTGIHRERRKRQYGKKKR